ncbi:NIPSNAP family containing protein [Mucilaginibacter conchicola]|uniref:NIPSNAP family containing protein n=1 Tax=Mucilaginibacter conchicola TaxID=2303333 RepID=A0A372NYK2_9SPHI|nr:NIPSNAP family protein [Mucilaginibacter conchicola]RFZ94597.1 NIPSNAP family containing protein [Mucilaginibacter conchicola]
MKRRSFVKQSLIGGAVAAVTPSLAMSQPKTAAVEYYELRVYTFKDERQQKLTEDFYRDVFIPTIKKATNEPVGVFTELAPTGQTKLFVLLPYSNFAQIDHLFDQLENNKDYWTKGEAYLNAPASNPAFEQLDTSILKAFKHSPVKELPAREERIFELRQYKSATEAAGKKKIEMFNDKGEIDIFKRLGFKPVFFGETVAGDNRPNLTYMVTFKNMDDKAAHWKSFVDDAEWKKISAPADYADALLVSKITSTMLKPTAYSLI